VSKTALEVARINCHNRGVGERVILLHGDLLEPLPEAVDILIANLPYVASADARRMPSARFEPRLALDGGKEGLDQLRRFNRQLKGKLQAGGTVLQEVGLGQSAQVASWLKGEFPSATIAVLKDLAGIDRMVKMVSPDGPERGTQSYVK
jgi:release factor glutamine methyltransferase